MEKSGQIWKFRYSFDSLVHHWTLFSDDLSFQMTYLGNLSQMVHNIGKSNLNLTSWEPNICILVDFEI